MRKTAAQFLASGDVDGLLALHQSIFGSARMEDAPATPPAPAPAPAAPAPAAPAAPDAAKTFTQADVDAIASRKEREAEQKATRTLAEKLGIEPDKFDDAASLIKAARDADAAKLSEAEKREQAAAAKEAAATAREAAAVARERDATIRAALAEAGCGKDDMTDARRLVDIADGDLDDKAVTTAVEDLKKRRPELFGGTKATPPASFTPPGSPVPGGQPSSMAERREHYRKQREAQKTA